MNDKGVSSFPTRKLLPRDMVPALDKFGFLSAFAQAEGFEACFGLELTLIVAPPWMGKSFVSKQLTQHLDRASSLSEAAPFGRYVHRTNFERDSGDDLLPSWWRDWLSTTGRACWIVDAVDEDGRSGARETHRVLNAVEALSREKRNALCLLMFARENEIPKQVEDRLRERYGAPERADETKYRILRLAPLDSTSARDLVGGDEGFSRVCKLITLNKLQSIAGYPAVIDTLSRYGPKTEVSDVEVWKEVLLDLIRDKNADPLLPARRSSLDAQFRAAARIAAILTFGDAEAVRETDDYADEPSVDSLIPLDHQSSQILNAAGRDVLRSGIFRRTARGFQFAQHHVQQWLAAFGVADLSLTRLRPLLTDSSGTALEVHRGVMGLLVRTSVHQAVKDWVIEQHGGVPPRSDAGPWDLRQSVAAIDRLQAIVKTTEWGLSLWNDRGLNFLATPGLGKELAVRLADPSLSRNERELIMDVALATREAEVVPVAMSVALDSSADARLRNHAASLVIVLGQKDAWLRLASELPKTDGKKSALASMRSGVVQKLFDEGVWDFATAAREAPEYESRSSLLHYRLEKAMTVQDARLLLTSVDVDALSDELKEQRAPRRGSRLARLVVRAIDLVANQDSLSPADFDALHPIALAQFRAEWPSADVARLSSVVAKDRDARRKLFMDVVARSPTGAAEVSGYIWPLFDTTDLDWILDVAEDDNGRHPWIWRRLLEVVSWSTVPADVRERVRQRGKEVVPAVLERIDRDKAAAEEREREYERQREVLQEEEKVPAFELAELVDETLTAERLPLAEKMRRLSWFCLCEDGARPTNVIGKWEDLGSERRDRVLRLCEQGLRECDPTPIPNGNSYPMSIVYEAYCFARVAELRSDAYALDAQQIEKWLQATLVTSMTRSETLVLRCSSAAPSATEAVLIKELQRSLGSEPQMLHWAESLPLEVWSQSFSQAVAAEVAKEQYALNGRRDLLRTLFARSKSHAVPVATTWLGSSGNNARLAAMDLLILSDPELVWEEFRRQIAAGGGETFQMLPSLPGHHAVPRAMTAWPATLLEELYELLTAAFPPESDPEREEGLAYSYGIEDRYRELRRGLTPLLLSRGTAEDIAALERLSSKFEATRKWYTTVRAQAAAGAVLGELVPGDPVRHGGSVPIAKVAKLLDVAAYRLVRTAADLQAVVLEELTEIARDAKEHLSCLYYPRKARKTETDGIQSPLQEDALQAYFYCRLNDRLKGRVLESRTRVLLDREPLTTKDQRLDIKVQAPTVDNVFVTVVIEIKWSNHPHVSTSLRTQLGQEYLINANLTHGIYLVGWYAPGKWRDETVTAPTDLSSLDAWRQSLTAQAAAFTVAHPTVAVVPLIVDLAWPSSASSRQNKPRRGRNSKARAAD